MAELANPATTAPAGEIAIGTLLAACDANAAAPLVIFHEGRPLRPGYHVTEVKAGQFAALDCGGNPEAWSEIFVQLWDIDEGTGTHMKAGKFAAIIRKVSEHVALDPSAKLTFEVSDGIAPMQLHHASAPVVSRGRLCMALAPRPASCKPRDRWLHEQEKMSTCCASPSAGRPCC